MVRNYNIGVTEKKKIAKDTLKLETAATTQQWLGIHPKHPFRFVSPPTKSKS